MNARKLPILLTIIVLAAAGFATLVFLGKITWFSEQPPLEFLRNMDLQFKSIPQSGNTYFSDRKSLRDPVEGTVARGEQPYQLGMGDVDLAESVNVDPNLPKTEFVMARGQNRFNVFCAACHNYDAKSQSKLVKRGSWLGIPDLTREQTVALSNARIFHIMSAGQNLMPSYADKISVTDRWAIIRYLRTLQGVEGVASIAPAVTTQAQ
ncbi:MAG: cytochrome c [Candidatus Kapabacteria bacterium]|nr:cytochrome c [Candidatus Kapabacteria bacterium]